MNKQRGKGGQGNALRFPSQKGSVVGTLQSGVEAVSWRILKDSHVKNVLPQGKVSADA